MAILPHSYSEQTVRQTVTSTTYTTVHSHASGNFVAGGIYFLKITALIEVATGATEHLKCRVIHGATPFEGSEQIIEQTNTAKEHSYSWFKLWTAIASEAIDIQIATTGSATVSADLICVTALRFDLNFTNGVDYHYAEVLTDSALTTTPLDGASITFTPVVSTNWLVLTTSQLDVAEINDENHVSQLVPSGTYTDIGGRYSRQGEDVAELFVATIGRVFEDLGAVSQTIKEQSFNEGGSGNSGNRLYSACFALNLNLFRAKAHLWFPDEEPLGTILWDDELAGLSLTPDIISDVWWLLGGVFVPNTTTPSNANEITHRMTIDAVDQPAGQTADEHQEGEPAELLLDSSTVWRQSLESAMSVAPHSMLWEAESTSATGGPVVKHRFALAVSMELSGDVPAIATISHEALAYVDAASTPPYEGITKEMSFADSGLLYHTRLNEFVHLGNVGRSLT